MKVLRIRVVGILLLACALTYISGSQPEAAVLDTQVHPRLQNSKSDVSEFTTTQKKNHPAEIRNNWLGPAELLQGLTQPFQQKNVWRDRTAKEAVRPEFSPRRFRALSLDVEAFRSILELIPSETGRTLGASAVFAMPLPEGGAMRFKVEEAPVMDPKLASRFPEIKTYRGQGVDDPTATTRFDWTPQGLHAIILSTHGTILIEPEQPRQNVDYISYFQGDAPPVSMECEVDSTTQEGAAAMRKLDAFRIHSAALSGTGLRTYRLALAATAEYTQQYGGGTVAGGLAAITTTINQVDAIYERELGIRLMLIANEDSIIFTDSVTDGYTSDNATSLISENQTKLDSVIGDANYDIGHVFDGRVAVSGLSFQGIASIAVACRTGVKGRGVSITRSVQPSSLLASYSTAHEMGHQFGATHTFNATSGACASQRNASTAYEPGTGSSIMGYRLTCAPEDLMSGDNYFHVASLEQIITYTTVGAGSCPALVATGNGSPSVNAGVDYTIPRDTPFTLTATASDPDGDALTYNWEEFDLGTPSPPNTDDGSRPILRSYAPAPFPARSFPLGANNGVTSRAFEVLPSTTRTMKFRVTVRDNRANGGAVNWAGMQVNVTADAGPFIVTSPAASEQHEAGSSLTVKWDVAGTNGPPINCQFVRIRLDIDNSFTYPIILANNTPNDGSETVTLPGTINVGYIKVEAVDNVFFSVTPGFLITGIFNPTPTISNFSPSVGSMGTLVTITGTNFLAPTAVRFNGINASFIVNSTTEIVAVVPSGAATGPITVTTVWGTATASQTFELLPIQLLLDTSSPLSDQVAALDSLLFLRDPFPVLNVANLLNPLPDRNTRVILFVANLQLLQNETASAVIVNLVDSNNQSYDLAAEDVRPVPNSAFAQIILRLPNNLATGPCTLMVRAYGQISNTGKMTIR